MSLLPHPPPHLPANPASIKTTTTHLNHSILRPPLLSIYQVNPSCSTACSSQLSPSSIDFFPTESSKPSPSIRDNRRKLRSRRTNSLAIPPPSLSSLPSRQKHLSRNIDAHHQDQTGSDIKDDDNEPNLRYKRLKLSNSFAPNPPPAILNHIMIPRSHFPHANTPLVEPSYQIPRRTPNDTHTCIRTKVNSHSVSVTSQPPVHFSKTILKLSRFQKSHLPLSADGQISCLETKRVEEQNKWWHWSKNCKITGDGNKSSHLTPLRCKNLKRKHYNSDDSPEREFKMQARPISDPTIERQKF